MRSSSLFGVVLGLCITCHATPFFDNKYPLYSRAVNSSTENTTCATGVHIIVARASKEAPGEGIIGAVATQVQQAIPGSDSEAVDYPATLNNYSTSEASGVAAMTNLIKSYVARCPSSKIALMGYSQGAQVTGDVLCGTNDTSYTSSSSNTTTNIDGAVFNTTKPLSILFTKNIVAVIQMGDPSHVPNLPQDVGNSTNPGLFPRLDTASCSSYASITQSYCNANDTYCDSGSSVAVHESYVQVYGDQAAQFVIDKVKASQAATGNESSSSGSESLIRGGYSVTFGTVAFILLMSFLV